MNDKMIKMVGYGFVLFVVVTCCVEAMEDETIIEENGAEQVAPEGQSSDTQDIIDGTEKQLTHLKNLEFSMHNKTDTQSLRSLYELRENIINQEKVLQDLKDYFAQGQNF